MCPTPLRRDTVHLRLYQGASDLRSKQEARRKATAAEQAKGIRDSREGMSWISQEMMRSRRCVGGGDISGTCVVKAKAPVGVGWGLLHAPHTTPHAPRPHAQPRPV